MISDHPYNADSLERFLGRPRRRFSRRVGSSWTRSLEPRPWRETLRLSFRRCAFDVRGLRRELGHGHVHDAELPGPLATSLCDSRDRIRTAGYSRTQWRWEPGDQPVMTPPDAACQRHGSSRAADSRIHWLRLGLRFRLATCARCWPQSQS